MRGPLNQKQRKKAGFLPLLSWRFLIKACRCALPRHSKVSVDSLCHHCVRNFQETDDVAACDEVVAQAVLLGCSCRIIVDAGHDAVKLLIDLFRGPGDPLGVLAHLKSADKYAAGICRLGRCYDDILAKEILQSFIGGRHVGDFDVILGSVGNDLLCDLEVNFVLCSARHDDVSLDAERLLAREELRACELVRIVSELASACTAVKQEVDLIFGHDAGLIKDVACGSGDGDRLCSEFDQFLCCAPGYVAVTGKDNGLTLDGVILMLQCSLQIVDSAVTGSFRTDKGSAVGTALAGKDAVFKCTANAAVLAIQCIVSIHGGY